MVLAEPLAELETNSGDPRDQDIRDLTLAAQGEYRGVTRVVVNNQQEVALLGSRFDAAAAASGHRQNLPSEQLNPDHHQCRLHHSHCHHHRHPHPHRCHHRHHRSPHSRHHLRHLHRLHCLHHHHPCCHATTLATLALAAVALPTKSRSSPNILSTKDVSSSSRNVGGGMGGGGTLLKEGCARSATSSTYSDYASLSCKEVLLEQVDSEVSGAKCEKMVPNCAKRVREAGDYEVESDVYWGGGSCLGTRLGGQRGSECR
ncbi:unnamed protein product [Closterium sp. NIES-53]